MSLFGIDGHGPVIGHEEPRLANEKPSARALFITGGANEAVDVLKRAVGVVR